MLPNAAAMLAIVRLRVNADHLEGAEARCRINDCVVSNSPPNALVYVDSTA